MNFSCDFSRNISENLPWISSETLLENYSKMFRMISKEILCRYSKKNPSWIPSENTTRIFSEIFPQEVTMDLSRNFFRIESEGSSRFFFKYSITSSFIVCFGFSKNLTKIPMEIPPSLCSIVDGNCFDAASPQSWQSVLMLSRMRIYNKTRKSSSISKKKFSKNSFKNFSRLWFRNSMILWKIFLGLF